VVENTWKKVAKIAFEVDVTGRKARLNVPALIDTRGEPIVNPVTGAEHRVCIQMPDGFEYTIAEIARGWTAATGPIAFNTADSNAHFAHLHMTQSGVIR
jgi:hypothetical protein